MTATMHLARMAVVAAVLATTRTLAAQACHGSPNGMAIAVDIGDQSLGNAFGPALSKSGDRVAWGLGYRRHEVEKGFSGHEGTGRFSLVLPASRVRICPTVTLGYLRESWDVAQRLTLHANTLTLGAGVGAGIEQRILFDYLHVIPFVTIRYEFNAIALDLDVPESDNDITPDTVSGLAVEYGLVIRFHNFLGGRILNRRTKDPAPYLGRWILGYTFGGRNER